MGIDIYAQWRGQTEAEKDRQITGNSISHGHVGYLREAYHGGPYATQHFVKEVFEADPPCVAIKASVLRGRLGKTLKLVRKRMRKLYKADDGLVLEAQQSYIDFVELCEKEERETGEPVHIYADY